MPKFRGKDTKFEVDFLPRFLVNISVCPFWATRIPRFYTCFILFIWLALKRKVIYSACNNLTLKKNRGPYGCKIFHSSGIGNNLTEKMSDKIILKWFWVPMEIIALLHLLKMRCLALMKYLLLNKHLMENITWSHWFASSKSSLNIDYHFRWQF